MQERAKERAVELCVEAVRLRNITLLKAAVAYGEAVRCTPGPTYGFDARSYIQSSFRQSSKDWALEMLQKLKQRDLWDGEVSRIWFEFAELLDLLHLAEEDVKELLRPLFHYLRNDRVRTYRRLYRAMMKKGMTSQRPELTSQGWREMNQRRACMGISVAELGIESKAFIEFEQQLATRVVSRCVERLKKRPKDSSVWHHLKVNLTLSGLTLDQFDLTEAYQAWVVVSEQAHRIRLKKDRLKYLNLERAEFPELVKVRRIFRQPPHVCPKGFSVAALDARIKELYPAYVRRRIAEIWSEVLWGRGSMTVEQWERVAAIRRELSRYQAQVERGKLTYEQIGASREDLDLLSFF